MPRVTPSSLRRCAVALLGVLLAGLTVLGFPADPAAAPKSDPATKAAPPAKKKSAVTKKAAPRKQEPAAAASPPSPKREAPAAAGDKPVAPGTQAPATPANTADCRVDTMDESGPVTYTVPIPVPGSKQRVEQCLMTPRQAKALADKGELLFVDTRPAAEFERYRIPGALSIPLAYVKTKAFLKPRAFALVDDGHESGMLEQTCDDLRAAGFKRAAVLRGGLLGWRRAHGTIEGDLLAQRELTRMAPAELAEEGGYADWLVVSVASAPATDLNQFLPKAVALPDARDDDRFSANLKAAIAKRTRKGAELNVLVVDDDGSRIERLQSLLSPETRERVMFLDGGFEGYRRFWSEQAAIWAAAERGPRKPRCGA